MSDAAGLLKLRAADAEDVQVISAVLQDAIAPACDMAFQADSKSFVLVVQRLRRETAVGDVCERICSALTVNGVTAVKTQGIDPGQGERMLDLLAIMLEKTGEKSAISLVFAGNARIRLELASWSAALEDFGEPWPALCHPCHDDNAA